MALDLFETYKWDGRPWIIAGMGPSFSGYKGYDLSTYNILGINRIVSKLPLTFCQIIDFYIVNKVEEFLRDNCRFLIIPYYPHFHYRPFFQMNINYLQRFHNILKELSDEGRLLAFNLSTIPLRHGKSPIVNASFFSAEAAVSLLAQLGVRQIRTIGIDGGTTRDSTFKDHGPCDPRGFDLQWKGIAQTIFKYNLDYQTLEGGIPDGLHKEIESLALSAQARQEDGADDKGPNGEEKLP